MQRQGMVVLVGVFVLASLGVVIPAAVGKPVTKEIPVTVTLPDSTASGYRILSDGEPYHAIINTGGNLSFGTGPDRQLVLDFSQPVQDPPHPNTGNNPFPEDILSVPVFLSNGVMEQVDGQWQGVSGGLLGIAIGETNAKESWLAIQFDDGDFRWHIRFDEYRHEGETDNVLITRTGENSWTFQSEPPHRAKLLSTPSRGPFQWRDYGNFYMPCSLTVEKQ